MTPLSADRCAPASLHKGAGGQWVKGDTPDDWARLRLLEAAIEVLKLENEFLKRRLAAGERRAAQASIEERLALAAERARPWWRRLAGQGA
jgi:hypothetical protein